MASTGQKSSFMQPYDLATPQSVAGVTIQQLLVEVARTEMELEMLRQRLVREGLDFNTVDAFRLLDTESKGEVDM